MADQSRPKIIEDNPIGKGLDIFRTSFASVCESRKISCGSDALDQFDQEGMGASFFVVYGSDY